MTVALNGDGGDEAFAGYRWHLAGRLAERWQRVPEPCDPVPKRQPGRSRRRPPIDARRRLASRGFCRGASQSRAARYRAWLSVFTPELRAELYGGRSRASGTDRLVPIFERHEDLDGVDAMLAADVDWYLPTDLLVKIDIATMANSLEGRSPFLDHPLAEFVATLPSRFKVKGWTSKYILKQAIADLVPAENLHRAKQGFAVPIGAWFRGELKEMLADHLLSPRFAQRGLFEPRAVQRLFDDHQQGRGDYAHHLWVLLMLELWFRCYIDSAPAIDRTVAVTA